MKTNILPKIVVALLALNASIFMSMPGSPVALANGPAVAGSRGVFGEGVVGDLAWELRANGGGCRHPGKPATWCDESDRPGILSDMAIEDTMVDLIRSPRIRFVAISYYAFGSPRVADALCEQAASRQLKVSAILQDWPVPRGAGSNGYKKIFECAATIPNLRVVKLGGQGGIHHAKIFLASESLDPFDPSMPDIKAKILVTVSSANLSHNGVGMHLENWLIMNGPASNPVLRGNWCYVKALPLLAENRPEFHEVHRTCLANAQAMSGTSSEARAAPIEFIPMPATKPAPKAIDSLLALIAGSRESVKVAAHIFTASRTAHSGLVEELIAAARRGVKVEILLDDNTEMAFRRLPGWQHLKVGSDDIDAVQKLLTSPVILRSVDTNEATSQLHHNKFIIVDGHELWTGSGNFTASSLAGRNTEQFYVIHDQAITAAFSRVWDLLKKSAVPFGELAGN